MAQPGDQDMRLREARRGEELAVAEVHVRSWQEAYRGLMPADFLDALDPRERAGRYTFEVDDADAPTTVLAVAGAFERILGFVTYGPSRDEDARGLGEVYALYVDPGCQRGGVGRFLMTEARRRLRESGFNEAILWVLRGNSRATVFYEREGWSPDATTRMERPYGIRSKVDRFRRQLP